MGTGKTTAFAEEVAKNGSTSGSSDRHEQVDDVVSSIEAAGGSVGRVLMLRERLRAFPIACILRLSRSGRQRVTTMSPGSAARKCERKGEPDECMFLGSIRDLKEASTIVSTKAYARRKGFFSAHGNSERKTVIIDEDAIGFMRPVVNITRVELAMILKMLKGRNCYPEGRRRRRGRRDEASSDMSRLIAQWLWEQIHRQQPGAQPEAVDVLKPLRPSKAVLNRTKKAERSGGGARPELSTN